MDEFNAPRKAIHEPIARRAALGQHHSKTAEDAMVGRVMPCIGIDGEFASDMKSRAAAVEWLAHLIAEGKHWSEARSEIVEFYSLAGMDYQKAHAKSKSAKPFLKPWLQPSSQIPGATIGAAQALSL